MPLLYSMVWAAGPLKAVMRALHPWLPTDLSRTPSLIPGFASYWTSLREECSPDPCLLRDFGTSDVAVQTINGLGKKARDGTISIDEMAGGTFTISNGGVYGSLLSTPIINPPQSAILGMHSINQRAMVLRYPFHCPCNLLRAVA